MTNRFKKIILRHTRKGQPAAASITVTAVQGIQGLELTAPLKAEGRDNHFAAFNLGKIAKIMRYENYSSNFRCLVVLYNNVWSEMISARADSPAFPLLYKTRECVKRVKRWITIMKKGLGTLLIAFAGVLLFPVTVLAGDINSAEQGVIDTISNPQEYNGAYYKVTDAYIAKVTEYLSQDSIDMTQAEADNYIAQFYANIAVGINAGYMEKTGDVGKTEETAGEGDETAEEPEADPAEEEPADNGDQTIGSTVEGALEYTVLPIEKETMYVFGVGALDVHAEAYKDSDTLGTLAEGDAVTVTGAASTGWAQIEYNEGAGYVSAAYLRTQGYVEAKEEAVEVPEETPKDYSNAKPVAKSLNLKVMALVIVVVFTIAIGGVIIYHKYKSKNKTRKR